MRENSISIKNIYEKKTVEKNIYQENSISSTNTLRENGIN